MEKRKQCSALHIVIIFHRMALHGIASCGIPLAQSRRDSSENPRREDGCMVNGRGRACRKKKIGEKESKRSFPFLIMTI